MPIGEPWRAVRRRPLTHTVSMVWKPVIGLAGTTRTIWLAGGWLASLVPGWRAYRLSLADGLSPRL